MSTPERECDYLCVGGGLGGIASALRADGLGLDVLVLEKTDLLGGVGAYSGGGVWVPNNHLARGTEFHDSAEQAASFVEHLAGQAGIEYDLELRAAFLEHAGRAVEWYTTQAGVPFELSCTPDEEYPDAPGSTRARKLEVGILGGELGPWRARLRPGLVYRSGLKIRELYESDFAPKRFPHLVELERDRRENDFLTRGAGLAGGFMRAAFVDREIAVELNSRVLELLQDDGRVVGAIASIGGRTTRITARRGVLIATGGYGSTAYAAGMEGLPSYVEQAPGFLDGDGLTLTDPTPAALVRAGDAFVSLGFTVGETHEFGDPVYYSASSTLIAPHTIVVNADGRRFCDESSHLAVGAAMRFFDAHRKCYPNFPCYLIVDEQYRRRFPLQPLDYFPEDAMTRADSIEELARALAISPEALSETVERFNANVEAGGDPDFGRGAAHTRARDPQGAYHLLGTIREPPFWAMPLAVTGTGICSHGLHIDPGARALTRDGAPVPGLYATGNAVAYTELHGYHHGYANARNITFAFLAAESAAADDDARQLGR